VPPRFWDFDSRLVLSRVSSPSKLFPYLHAKFVVSLVFWRWRIALPFPSLAPCLLFLFFYPCSWPVSTLVLVLLSSFCLSFFCFWNCEIRANLLRVLLLWSIVAALLRLWRFLNGTRVSYGAPRLTRKSHAATLACR
jgi:hypothetical protein